MTPRTRVRLRQTDERSHGARIIPGVQHSQQRRRPQLARFLELIGANVKIEDAFQQAFQTSVDAFEKDFRS